MSDGLMLLAAAAGIVWLSWGFDLRVRSGRHGCAEVFVKLWPLRWWRRRDEPSIVREDLEPPA